MKHCTPFVEVHHQAWMAAANPIYTKQCGLIDLSSLLGSTFQHRKTPQNNNGSAQVTRSSWL
jgi:hypothetical protein